MRSAFQIFQYFISVVSTTYIDAGRRRLDTNQYSVTDMARETEHGRGVPGLFFKFDQEPMKLNIEERTMGFLEDCGGSPRATAGLVDAPGGADGRVGRDEGSLHPGRDRGRSRRPHDVALR